MRILAIVTVLLAGACSKAAEPPAPPTGNMTAAAVSAEATKLVFRPGEWETRTQVAALRVPGVAPETLKGATDTPTITRSCMSAADAAKPSADFMSGTSDGNCVFQRFSLAGGRVDAAMTCAPAGAPAKAALTLKGTYAPESFAQTMNMIVDLPGEDMTMTARVAGRRIGACAAGTTTGTKGAPGVNMTNDQETTP